MWGLLTKHDVWLLPDAVLSENRKLAEHMGFEFFGCFFQVSSFKACHYAIRVRKGLCPQCHQQYGSAIILVKAGQGEHWPAEVAVEALAANADQQQPEITSPYNLMWRYLALAATSTGSSLATNPSWLSWKAVAFHLSSEGRRQGPCG